MYLAQITTLKFNENPFRSKRDIELTQNARLKLVTYESDLGLESAWLSYGFCTPSHCGEHFSKVNENLFKGSGDMERTRKC